MVNDLNTSGAVRLETLDGEPMGNYINGSRLKRYEEPMREDMLACLHKAQTQKKRVKLFYGAKQKKKLKPR